MRSYGGGGGIALPFLTSVDGGSGQVHDQAALLPRKELPVPTGWEVGWAVHKCTFVY
jgi:hypothetical protein